MLIMQIVIDSAPAISHCVPCICLCLPFNTVPPFNVPSERCVAPTLDYSALTTLGLEELVCFYTMSQFTSSCSGRVVGYWFCYQSTRFMDDELSSETTTFIQ